MLSFQNGASLLFLLAPGRGLGPGGLEVKFVFLSWSADPSSPSCSFIDKAIFICRRHLLACCTSGNLSRAVSSKQRWRLRKYPVHPEIHTQLLEFRQLQTGGPFQQTKYVLTWRTVGQSSSSAHELCVSRHTRFGPDTVCPIVQLQVTFVVCPRAGVHALG